MLSVRTNQSQLAALNALDRNSSDLAASQTRLSTGYRINSARDDAAGLQLASRLSAQAHGMKVAMRNTQNAIAMIQTADGLFGEIDAILGRVTSLAVTAADTSVSQADRDALHAEYVDLSKQVFDIMQDASYAGTHLLRYIVASPGPNGPGTMGSGPLTFQIGESADQTATEDFRPGLGDLNGSLYYALDNGSLYGQPVDAPGTELTSAASANALIGKLADASRDVNALRAQCGAFGNRLDSVYRNLSNMSTNAEAVRGRIVDVDFAEETANATRRQMLVQAGGMMVKQSASAAQLVRSLIE